MDGRCGGLEKNDQSEQPVAPTTGSRMNFETSNELPGSTLCSKRFTVTRQTHQTSVGTLQDPSRDGSLLPSATWLGQAGRPCTVVLLSTRGRAANGAGRHRATKKKQTNENELHFSACRRMGSSVLSGKSGTRSPFLINSNHEHFLYQSFTTSHTAIHYRHPSPRTSTDQRLAAAGPGVGWCLVVRYTPAMPGALRARTTQAGGYPRLVPINRGFCRGHHHHDPALRLR